MTRHNVGFMVLDVLAKRWHTEFKQGKGKYLQASFHLEGEKVLLVKPLTFMNLSGQAVRAVIHYFNFTDLSRLLVICDDLNLPFGTIRLRRSGSDGGQKGLRSVIQELNTEEIPRLRIGIGNGFSDAVRYVLSPFSKEEQKFLPEILNWAADAVEVFITEGIERAMSKFNRHIIEI